MWFTARSGLPSASASPLAKLHPTKSAAASPGPRVAAMASTLAHGSGSPGKACARASSATPRIFSTWARLATSGTTPP